MFSKKIILASKSPRRSQLLSEAGFEFEVKTVDTPEDYPDNLPKREVAEFLACKKARAARHFLEDKTVLLAADSTVLLHGKIYEKPVDLADAKRIIGELSGQVHEVITGVCLLDANREISFSGVTKVHFDTLTPEEIDHYVETYQPLDKAGAYGVQEWIGHCKIKKIEGTYTNVMGLPVSEVYKALELFY